MTRAEKIATEIKEQITNELIGDKSIPWDDCCDALEGIEEHVSEWSKQIRSEHE